MVTCRKAGAVDPEWETNPQKAFFQRASRTDKGVSAAKMIVSLKLLDDPGTIRKESISSALVEYGGSGSKSGLFLRAVLGQVHTFKSEIRISRSNFSIRI
jgi:hypothetical protein